MPGALNGIRVIDFSQWIAGPLSALLPADQGTEVTHVDRPGGPRWQTAANASLQRGKKSLSLDLKNNTDLAADRPSGQPFAINDYCPGLLGAFGLGLGLLHRLRTGGGAGAPRDLTWGCGDILATAVHADIRGQDLE
jgi:crotonobetainyl-CoA:carnitine CoA-transferase CaiB-like acyl-CoA transferase